MTNRRELVVYCAGPFRSPHAWGITANIFTAAQWSLEVWRAGFVALCPHLNTAPFQGSLPDEVWLDGDLELVKRSDAVLLLPRWEESAGARSEKAFAEDQGIPCFTVIADLEAWADVTQR